MFESTKLWWSWALVASACAQAPARPAPRAPEPKETAAAEPAAEPAPAPAAPAAPEVAPEVAEPTVAVQTKIPPPLPTECSGNDKLCTPPSAFVQAACKQRSGDLALTLFKKGTPWQRAYLRGNIDAWYAGSKLATPARLFLDEEVLVLAARVPTSGIVVGGGSYDVLRWDGSCVSVMADEVTFQRPPVQAVARIFWRRLAGATRRELKKDRGIAFRRGLVEQRCKDNGEADACIEARRSLSELIAQHVRSGGKLPDGELVIMW